MLCPHGRGNAPEKVGYDESVSNLMFNEEVGYMDTHTCNQTMDHRAQFEKVVELQEVVTEGQ